MFFWLAKSSTYRRVSGSVLTFVDCVTVKLIALGLVVCLLPVSSDYLLYIVSYVRHIVIVSNEFIQLIGLLAAFKKEWRFSLLPHILR